MEFRSKKLDKSGSPASVDLSYVTDRYGSIDQTSAVFHDGAVTFHRLRSGKKNQTFRLSGEEFSMAIRAWELYQSELDAMKVAEAARVAAIIEEAMELASTGQQFDYEPLNIQITKDEEYNNLWRLYVPAIAYFHAAWLNELVTSVETTLTKIKTDVEHYERCGYSPESDWAKIVASYRRAYPIEPEEITEARKLLEEAGLTGWKIEQAQRTESHYTFYGPFGTSGQVLMSDEVPSQLLTDVKEYLARKESDKILDQMDADSDVFLNQEPAEIIRQLIEESSVFTGDC